MYLEEIHTILETKRAKSGRIGARLAFHGHAAAWFWMSSKQWDKLLRCFQQTGNGYSCAKATVYGVFDREDRDERFVWAGVHTGHRSELPFLAEHFGVEIPRAASQDIEMMQVPEHVEIHPDLLD